MHITIMDKAADTNCVTVATIPQFSVSIFCYFCNRTIRIFFIIRFGGNYTYFCKAPIVPCCDRCPIRACSFTEKNCLLFCTLHCLFRQLCIQRFCSAGATFCNNCIRQFFDICIITHAIQLDFFFSYESIVFDLRQFRIQALHLHIRRKCILIDILHIFRQCNLLKARALVKRCQFNPAQALWKLNLRQ